MTSSPLARDYLDDLREIATRRLGPSHAAELVDDIRAHIDAAISSGRPVAEVLERLGGPAEIVAAEAPPEPTAHDRPAPSVPAGPRLRVREVLAIALLLVGLPLAGIGWLVGAVLLWLSDRWSTRDKLIGTLLWPGGLGLFLAVGLLPGEMSATVCDASGCTTTTSGGTSLPPWLGIVLAVVLVAVPLWTSVHLARSARAPRG